MEIRLLQAARADLDDAYLFYEEQLPGLGKEFLNEILAAFKRIKSYPESWPPFSNAIFVQIFTDMKRLQN